MATVYRNAYLTIVAGIAASSDEGFLMGRRHAAGEENQVYRATWPFPSSEPELEHPKTSSLTVLAARILPYFAHAPPLLNPSQSQS